MKKNPYQLIRSFLMVMSCAWTTFAQVPVITSFTPLSAKPGDAVILTGSNFNATASNNIVFFGATRVSVISGNATTVTVTVPSGATYAPITLLNTGSSLAASSVRNFTPTYSPAKPAITATDFQAKQDFTTGTYSNPQSVAVGDLDGDGKPDLVVANNGRGTVSVYRNMSTSGSIGTGSFAVKVDFDTGIQPVSVAIGDLNGDGKLDLAVANSYGSGTVSVFRNTATSGNIDAGSFAVKVDFATGTSPISVAIGDLDGDGKPELAVANGSSSTVSVFRNTATSGSIDIGSFATKVDFTTGENSAPQSVALGDLDGDGKPELVTANQNSTVSVFRNTATSGSIDAGSFAAKVDFTTGANPRSIALGDLDGDGKPELAVANGNVNTVSVFRNTATSGSSGTVSFATKVDFTTGTSPHLGTQSVALGDLDGDGKPDLVVANIYSSTVSVFRNTATSGGIDAGSFVAMVDFATGYSPYSVAIGDLDGDGKPELATANYGSNTVSVLRNMDLPPVITSFSPVSAKPSDAVTLTGTNFNPIFSNNIVFFGATRANVTSGNATTVTVTVPSGATYAPLTLLNTGSSLVASSVRNFTPTYSPAKTAFTTTDFQAKQDFTTGTQTYFVAVGDLDGDGKPDLAVVNYGSSTVSVYRNTATSGSIALGSFAAKVDFATDFAPQSVAIGDLDGDGKPELAVANSVPNTVSVLRNTATPGSIDAGSFAAKVDFATETAPRSVAMGDLDGDGKLDLAVVNAGSHTVSVYRNTTTSGSIVASSFAPKIDFATDVTPYSVAVGDLDGDGKPELAVTNYVSATVSVFRNTATSGSIALGSFAAKVDFTTGSTPFSVAMGDLDGDGKSDLAVANYNSGTVSVIRNTSSSGTVSFATKVDFTTGTSPSSVALGDLDGDGKPELAVTNYNSSTVSVFRNTSSSGSIVAGSFAVKVDFATGTQPISVALGDLDGDGKPELAVANYGSTTVSVLRNADANADLSALTLSAGTLSPAFTAANIAYSASVTNATNSVTVTPTLANANASVKVNGIAVVSGSTSGALALNEGSNTITVVVTAQNASTKTYTLTIFRTILPTFTAIAPICSGATLAALPTTSNNGISGTWSPALNNTLTTTYTFTPNAGQDAISTTITVTVNANPTATASSGTPVICAGNTISLTGGGSVGTYAWSGPNSFTATNQSPTIASATTLASGVYTITVKNSNNCTSTATTSVTVNPLPVVNAGANQTICEGSTSSLTAICNLLNVSATLNGPSQVPTNASMATGTISGTFDKVTKQLLLTISFNGLAANASAAHLHKGAVGVNGVVQVSFSGVPSATSGSFTYAGTLTPTQETDLLAGLYYANIHNASFPNGEIRGQLSTSCVATNFVWNPGNLSGQTVTISPTITQTYTVTASNTTTGCSTTATTTVSVNQRPVPTIGSNTPICAGNTLNLTSSGGSTYAWTGVNGFASTDQNPTIPNATLSNSGTYKVTVTNVNGCTSTATTSVTVNPPTTATVTLSPTTICAGTSGSITPTITNGGSNYSYVWRINSVTQTTTSPTINYSTATGNDEYSLTVTPSADACPFLTLVTTSVRITPLTILKVSIMPAIVCENTDRTLSVLSSSGSLGTAPSYVWKRNNVTLATSSTISVTSAVLGDTYAVTVTFSPDASCYTATSSLIVGCISSITSGNWENPTTWNLNRVPVATDNAVINNNHNVTITTNGANAKKAEVRPNAKLIYGNSAAKLKVGF